MNVKLIKKQGKATYKNKKGEEKHFYNYFLVFENGKMIQIKPAFNEDARALDVISEYVK